MSASMAPVPPGTPQGTPSGTTPLSAAQFGNTIGQAEAQALLAEVDAVGMRIATVRAAIGRVIFGQQDVVDQTLITLLSGGHVLLVGVPGLGKSRLVETLGTVGYGNMAPVTHLGHAIAATEILIGLFFSATITGLIFARFARPRTSFVFSRVAVLGQRENRRTLMVRLASTRLRPIANVNAQLSWLQKLELTDGRVFRQLVEPPVVTRESSGGIEQVLAVM